MAYKNSNTSGFTGTTPGNDVILTVPSNAVEGDKMVVCFLTDDNTPDVGVSPPSSETWTLEESGSMPLDGTGATSNVCVWIYSKDVSADDEANAGSKEYIWSVVTTTTEEQAGILLLYDPCTWGQFATNLASGSVTSRDAPSVTTTDANEIVLHCCYKDAGVVFTGVPSGDATRLNDYWGATSGAGGAFAMVEETYESPGATGVKTFTLASMPACGFTFSLVPLALVEREQAEFRFYADGTESGSTALAAQNVDIEISAETVFQTRVGMQAVGDPSAEAATLQYKETSDPATEWRNV